MKYSLALATIIFLAACNGGDTTTPVIDNTLVPKETPKIAYTIDNVYPHDTSAYTQGLQLYNGKLYEGTGDYASSALQIVDLKTGKLTHQDIGQMDMYVRMYDDLKRGPDDNPTVGILLCDHKDQSVARYSVLKDSEQLFATKYRLILPSEEDLRAEIERERAAIEDAQRLDADE